MKIMRLFKCTVRYIKKINGTIWKYEHIDNY